MESLVGYGSDDDIETDHIVGQKLGAQGGSSSRRRDDDTNYDDVNMDLSEESQSGESEPELPPAEPQRHDDRRAASVEERRDDRDRDRDRDKDRGARRRDSPRSRDHDRSRDRDHDRRETRRDDRHRSERRDSGSSRRSLLGDRPDDQNTSDNSKMPSLLELKPFGGEPPGALRSADARDAASPRFSERERRDRDKDRERERERERERDRDRHRRSDDNRSSSHRHERRSRSPRRDARPHAALPPPECLAGPTERRPSPPVGEYRPSSYKVNKKLEVMEKMGLQIKTPDGSMATAQQLRRAACEQTPAAGPPGALPSYYNPTAVNTTKILDQVQKRKMLWANKGKADVTTEAAKWSGTRFAQDQDGRQASKFMRLMGIKEPTALQAPPPDKTADPIKKQEEMFQAMQAQYEVARATTHTMRGVGLGFQRGQF